MTEEERLRFGFETEGFQLRAGPRPAGYAEGTLGWAVDEPSFVFPDGTAWVTRLTAVMHQMEGRWRLVHMHVSVGVPDEETLELQARWGTTPAV